MYTWGVAVMLELMGRGPRRPDLLEDLVVAESDVVRALARWSAPAPVVLDPAGGGELPDALPDALPDPEALAAALAGGTPVLLDVDAALAAGTERALVDLADLVIVAAHSGVGFGHGLVPRCTTAPRVWSLLAGAVAAMTGEDVPRALAAPDPSSLTGLGRSAREAVRDVVTCVAVPGDGAARVAAALEPTSSVDP